MFKITSTDDFLKSFFDRLFSTSDERDLLFEGVKFMYVNSNVNGGRLTFNDLIDLSNITFIDKLTDKNVIYATRDKRWRRFIVEQAPNHPKLATCFIIGDEGQFD